MEPFNEIGYAVFIDAGGATRGATDIELEASGDAVPLWIYFSLPSLKACRMI